MATPTNITDRINGVLASLAIKVRCVVGITTNVASLSGITNPYSGVAVVDGDRVLLLGQTDPIENGIWCVNASTLWTRAPDWDGIRDVQRGATVWAGRSAGSDTLFQVQTSGNIIPGTTPVSINQIVDPDAFTAPSLQAVTAIGKTTTQGIDVTGGAQLRVFNAIADASLTIDVADLGGPVSVVANSSMIVTATVAMDFNVDAAGGYSFDVGNNNAMSINDNIVRVNTDSGGFFQIRDDIGSNLNITMSTDGPNLIAAATVGGDPDRYLFQPAAGGEGLSLLMFERASARADIAGYGQVFIRSATPNVLVFRDDAGQEFDVAGVSAPLTATTAQLVDIANAVNTESRKVAGLQRFNTTTGAPVWSVGAADGSVWNDAIGVLAHTPV